MSKRLIFQRVLPMTVLLFTLVSKWWIVDVVDGTDGIMYGFPLIYRAPAFYTSGAIEYFILELIADLSIYFTLLLAIVYLINKFLIPIRIKKIVSIGLFFVSALLISFELFLACSTENKFSLFRDYDLEIKKTGIEYPLNENATKEFEDYHP